MSQTVAALCGPSISGFCAGLVFGNRTARRCSVRTRARLAAVCFGVCAAELPRADAFAGVAEELEPVTCEKPWSEAAAAASGATAVGSGAAAAESAGTDRSCEAAAAVAAAAAESSVAVAEASAAGGAASVAVSVVVVVSVAAASSLGMEADSRSPATAASDAPAKKRTVKTNVVANRRLRDLGSRGPSSVGSGLPPKSQFSLRENHRGIAVSSF